MNKETIRFSLSLATHKEPDGTVWNEIAYAGQWAGHPSGDFQFTREIFDEIVSNSKRRSDAMPVRFGHPDMSDPIAMQMAEYLGQAGWIQELKIEKNSRGKDALFGRMKWTERTASKINADEIRYCSVVVTFGGVDEVTGEDIGAELIELGIVGAAFLDGMTPLAASRTGRAQPVGRVALDKESSMDELAITKKIMKELGENFTIAKLAELAENEIRRQEIIEGKESGPDTVPEEDAEEDVAASDTAADTVAAGDAPNTDVELELPGEAPPEEEGMQAEGMAVDFLMGLASEAGLDLPALIARLDENRDAVMAALGGVTESGTEADNAAMAKSHSDTIHALARSEADKVELSRQNKELTASLELAKFDATLSRMRADGEILDNVAVSLMKTATDEDYGDKAIKFARKQLAEHVADEGAEKPPKTGALRGNGAPYKSGSRMVAGRTRREILAACREEVIEANPALARAKRNKVHNAALELAKSKPEWAEASE